MRYESRSKATLHAEPNTPSEALISFTPRWFNRLLAYAAVFTLIGCASINVTPLPIDSPRPSTEVLGIEPVYCLQMGVVNFYYTSNRKVLVKLSPGESCWFVVQSEAVYNPTGLEFSDYKITVPDGQFMFDASRQVKVPEGDEGTWLTRLFNYAKRKPASQWFVLVAATCGNAINDQSIDSSNHDLKMPKKTEFLDRNGELCFYVNDVPRHYQNNSGRVWINIKKL